MVQKVRKARNKPPRRVLLTIQGSESSACSEQKYSEFWKGEAHVRGKGGKKEFEAWGGASRKKNRVAPCRNILGGKEDPSRGARGKRRGIICRTEEPSPGGPKCNLKKESPLVRGGTPQ